MDTTATGWRLSFLSYFCALSRWAEQSASANSVKHTEHTVQYIVFTFSFSVKRCSNTVVINHHSSAEEFRPALLHKSCPMLSELLLNCDWGEYHCRTPSDSVHDEHFVFLETVLRGSSSTQFTLGLGSYTGTVFRTHAGSYIWPACFISPSQLTCVSTCWDTEAAVVSLWDVTGAKWRTGQLHVQRQFHVIIIPG